MTSSKLDSESLLATIRWIVSPFTTSVKQSFKSGLPPTVPQALLTLANCATPRSVIDTAQILSLLGAFAKMLFMLLFMLNLW